MNEEDIIGMAREAEIPGSWDLNWFDPYLDRFAKLVAAHVKKPWVGLTKEEAKEINLANRPYVIDMIAALEARLKEKNGG
jgi:hypothetical protein